MKSIDCVALGEVLIDLITTEEGERELVGGSPANLIINLAQLGHPVRLISATGDDAAGMVIRNRLKHFHIQTDSITKVAYPTSRVRLNQSLATPVPTFERGADFHIEYHDALATMVKAARIFHFTYWPLSASPAKDTVFKLIDVAKAHDTLISFDPNYHPDLHTENGLIGPELMALLTQIDVIKPSLDDAKRLFEMDGTKETFMDRFEALNIPLIILTLGEDGVYISDHKVRTHIPAKATEIVDTTGAGDAFMAGFLSKYLSQSTLTEAVAFAQTMSAQALKTIGAIAPVESLKGHR